MIDTLKSYKDSLIYKQASFSLGLSLLYTLIIGLAAFEWETFEIRPQVMILMLANGIFSIIQAGLVWKLKRESRKTLVISKSSQLIAGGLIVSLLGGNIFLLISSLHIMKKQVRSGYIYAVYMVVTDLLVIGVSALNLFKPFVTNTFIPAMALLLVVVVLHLIVLVGYEKVQKLTGVPRMIILVILTLTVLTGNLFVLLVAYSMVRQSQEEPGVNRRKTLFEKIIRNQASMTGLLFIIFLVAISICSYWFYIYLF